MSPIAMVRAAADVVIPVSPGPPVAGSGSPAPRRMQIGRWLPIRERIMASEKIVGARQLVRNHEPVLALPQDRTRSLGVVERNSFRFFPADRLARSNGTNGTEKTE